MGHLKRPPVSHPRRAQRLVRERDLAPAARTPAPARGLSPPRDLLALQRLAGNRAVMRQLEGGGAATAEAPAEAEPPAFGQDRIDEITSRVIAEQLEAYQDIAVSVTETPPMPEGEVGPPAPVVRNLSVRSAYFINTETAREHVEAGRKGGFSGVVRALRNEVSELNRSNGTRMSTGQAVRFGKASPEDIQLFVDRALADGVVLRRARKQGDVPKKGFLVDLGDDDLRRVVQEWMYAAGVGVDCTGFANIAAIRAREAVQAEMAAAGIPADQMPEDLARGQRPDRGDQVTAPSDLRPGDLWTTNGGAHVRLVMRARTVAKDDGSQCIEFDTAESSGGSTNTRAGPTEKTWRTASLDTFQPITLVNGPAGPSDGTFNRIGD